MILMIICIKKRKILVSPRGAGENTPTPVLDMEGNGGNLGVEIQILKTLQSKLATTDSLAKERFVNAIKDPKIIYALLFEGPADLDEAVRLLVRATTHYESKTYDKCRERNINSSMSSSVGYGRDSFLKID